MTAYPNRHLAGALSAALIAFVLVCRVIEAPWPRAADAGDALARVSATGTDIAVVPARARIQQFAAANPAGFGAVLRQTFGTRLDVQTQRALVQQAAAGRLPLPARIVWVPSAVLDGARGAHSARAGGVIFLDRGLRDDPVRLTDVMIHEWAHHLDTTLGPGDATGEEGHIFLLGEKRRGPIPFDVHRRLARATDGHASIVVDGKRYVVEQGLFGDFFSAVGNGLKSVGNGIGNIAKQGVKLVGNGVKAVGQGVKGAVLAAGGTIAAIAGDTASANKLFNSAGTAFEASGKSLERGAGNALDAARDLKNAHEGAMDALDQIVPGLGTVGNIASAVSPAGPFLAGASSIDSVRTGYQNGGLGGALLAGGGELLKHGASKVGGKGLKKSRVFRGGKNKNAFDWASSGLDEFSGQGLDAGHGALAVAPGNARAPPRPPARPVSATLALRFPNRPGEAERSIGRIARSTSDPEAKTTVAGETIAADSPEISLEVRFDDGEVVAGYHRNFSPNIIFDDVSGDPGDIVKIVNMPADFDDPNSDRYPGILAATGKGVGIAFLRMSLRDAPHVTASVAVEVVDEASLHDPLPAQPNDPPIAASLTLNVTVDPSLGDVDPNTGDLILKNRIAISRDDPAAQSLSVSPEIELRVTFPDGTTAGPHDYHRYFAGNVVFDDASGDPGDIIQVQTLPVDEDYAPRGQFAAFLTPTGKGVGSAEFRVSFRNAPALVSTVSVEVVNAAMLEEERVAKREQAREAARLAEREKQREAERLAALEREREAARQAVLEREREAAAAARRQAEREAEQARLQAEAQWAAEQERLRAEAAWEAEQERLRQQAAWEAAQETARRQAEREAAEQEAARQRAWEAQQAADAAARQRAAYEEAERQRQRQAAAANSGKQATCYFNYNGNLSGSQWGNHGQGGALGVGRSQRLAYEGDYAFVFIVESNYNGEVTCPRQLSLECEDCEPGAPRW
jgi:hypothetical protein